MLPPLLKEHFLVCFSLENYICAMQGKQGGYGSLKYKACSGVVDFGVMQKKKTFEYQV